MSTYEIVLWGACLGVYASYACLSLFHVIYHRALVNLQSVVFVMVCGGFVLFGSGLAATLFKGLSTAQELRWVMGMAALSTAYSAVGLRNFLRAEQRDTLVDKGMLGISLLGIALLLAQFLPDQRQALEIVAVVATGCALVAFWLTLRAWLLGDRFALPMTLACAAMATGVLGLFGISLGMLHDNLWLQAVVAICAALYVAIVCHTLKQQHSEYRRMSKALAASREKDLLTQLWTGVSFIRKVDESIARAKRNRKELAILCVEIYNTSLLRQEFGNNGVEQVIYGMAARIRRHGGGAFVIGRYSDTSFMVVLESVKQLGYLRTVGLKLASGARRPYMLDAFSSDPREFKADIGVGIARVANGRQALQRQANTSFAGGFDSFSVAQEVLHEAAELAIAARSFGSRAAIVDSYSRKPIALENAELS